MTPKTIKQKKKAMADRAGVDLENVGIVKLQLQRMQLEGVLIDLDFHGGHLFVTRATYQELGIPSGDMRRKRIRAGSKALIPDKYLKKLRSIETRFRQSLDRYTYQIGAFGTFRWLPFTAYDAWREEWDRLQAELAELKQEILDNYWAFMDALAADFAKIANEAWEAIIARRQGNEDFALQTNAGTFTNRESFVDHVVSRAQAKMPEPDEIKARLYADYRTAVMLSTADIEEDRLAASRMAHQREAERRAADNEYRIAQEELEEREAKLEAIRQAELEHAREQMARMGSPIQQAFNSLRAQMNQDALEILAGLKKHGRLRGRASERVANLIETFHLLGGVEILEDYELARRLDEMKLCLDTYRATPTSDEGQRDAGITSLTAALDKIKDLTHEAAEDLKEIKHSRFARLEV